MEVAMEVEDDVFFADLSKRISLLIMDEDEDPVAPGPSVALQAFSPASHQSIPSPYICEQTYRRESKGTGVFIPQSSLPRRKSRQGRITSFNTKCHKQQPDNSRGFPPAAYNYSSNTKRC